MVKNSYSSGRNDDRLANPNGKNERQAFANGEIEGEDIADLLPCHQYSAVGNMNLNTMLVENIRSHDYFKGLSEFPTFEEVVDQTYYDCKFVTPWVPGTHKAQRASGMCSGLRGVSNAGAPSTGYMLLFKYFTLQLTNSQIKRLITHADSPYIRALGFLYLRYVCDPKQLFSWYEPYVHDSESFSEEGNSQSTTIGAWLRRLLTDQEYHDTMLPRLPVPVARDILKKLEESDAEHGVGHGGASARDGELPYSKRDERDERDERPDYRDDPGAGRPSARDDRRDYDRHGSGGGGESYYGRGGSGSGGHRGGERYDDRRGSGYERPRDYDRGYGGERGRDDRGGGGGGGGSARERGPTREYDRGRDERRDERRDDRRDDRREYTSQRHEEPDRRPPPPQASYGGASYGGASYGGASYGGSGHGERTERPAEREPYHSGEKRPRSDAGPAPGGASSSEPMPPPPPAKVETTAEKLAKLRAKQAARVGSSYLTDRVGSDYEGGTGGGAGASKGLARYQDLVKGGRH